MSTFQNISRVLIYAVSLSLLTSSNSVEVNFLRTNFRRTKSVGEYRCRILDLIGVEGPDVIDYYLLIIQPFPNESFASITTTAILGF